MEQKIDILYVEDDLLTAKMIKVLLEERGFNVRIACNVFQAWEFYNNRIPDMLLVDFILSGKNGLDLLKLVREYNKLTPIVFYSSHMDAAIEIEAFEAGVDDCIYKKCNHELFIAKLKKIYQRMTQGKRNPQIYCLSDSTKFNVIAGILTTNGKYIPLKSTDARLLHLLCVKFNEVAEIEFLIHGLWGKVDYWRKENALRKCVKQLRDVLEVDPILSIENCYGQGYCLTVRNFHS